MCGLLPPSALTASKVYISVFRDLRSLFGSGSESVVVLCRKIDVSMSLFHILLPICKLSFLSLFLSYKCALFIPYISIMSDKT